MTRPGPVRIVAVAAATLIGAGTAYLAGDLGGNAVVTGSVHAPADPAPSVPTTAGPTRPEPAVVSPVPSATAAQVPGPAPARITVPRLGIDMPVRPEGVDAQGRMSLPEDPGVAGWYRFGPAPADDRGAVVIAAHVDSREHGVGPFARLTSLRAGDQVVLEDGVATWRYRVERIDRVAKDGADLATLFRRDGAPGLHLVTCTGRYDRTGGYAANLVALATPGSGGG